MHPRVMIDIEAFGKAPTGRIASIGAYAGRTYSGQELCYYANIDQASLSVRDYTYDQDTLDWWEKQSQEAKDALQPNQISIQSALAGLSQFIMSVKGGDREIWANPPSYDLEMIRHAYKVETGRDPPWHWRRERCFRTVRAIGEELGVEAPKREGRYHNALDDAKNQYEHMRVIMERIKHEGRLL